jgi:hypothetical protein
MSESSLSLELINRWKTGTIKKGRTPNLLFILGPKKYISWNHMTNLLETSHDPDFFRYEALSSYIIITRHVND